MPHITFYTYTKSLMLDFSKKPKNLVIIKSYGGKYDHLINPKTDHHSRVIFDKKVPRGYTVGNDDDLVFLKTKKIALLKH